MTEQTWRSAIRPYVTDTTTVLDVGAGTGRFERGLRDLRTFADRGDSDPVYSPSVLAVFRPRRA